jgi:hypothetical protein
MTASSGFAAGFESEIWQSVRWIGSPTAMFQNTHKSPMSFGGELRAEWAQGLQLPANELLAAEFGVSRVTIRQAVELLARDESSKRGMAWHLHYRHAKAGSLA